MSYVKNQINKYPQLREKLLRMNDLYFEYRQIILGSLIRNPAYLRHIFRSKVIAEPGTLKFPGGVFNPGAVQTEDEIILLARSQVVPWFKARGKKKKFYLEGSPVIFKLESETLRKKTEYVIDDLEGFPADTNWSIEDLRMFRWKKRTIINHSVVVKEKIGKYITQGTVYSGLSVLENSESKIKFLGIPLLDFETQKVEKNWVYKEKDSQLVLFYSSNPYRVLILENENELIFRTVISQQFERFKNPGGFNTMVSFSTNPIDYDEQHWIMIVHQIDHKVTGRCYYHWAVLIDKETLLPGKMTSKPLFSGMGARGRTPGVRYISSILKRGDEILFFAGEGDVYVTLIRKNVREIESLFVNLH